MKKSEYKDKIEAAKREFLIGSDEEAHDACKFVAKLIEIELERVKANEPYAVHAIRMLKNMETEVYHLFDDTISGQLESWVK